MEIFPIEQNKNKHGQCFISFLKDIRSVILNGRITPENNNYPYICSSGISVPDYMFCRLDNLNFCTKCSVVTMSDLVNNLDIEPPGSLPDHSLIISEFSSSFYQLLNQESKSSHKPS